MLKPKGWLSLSLFDMDVVIGDGDGGLGVKLKYVVGSKPCKI